MAFKINSDFKPPNIGIQEIVERKGIGHPDTLVDGIVEATEIEYAKYCLKEFGVIPHHNLDKASLRGGLCKQEFGGGDYQYPINMLFMGRASRSFGGETIPLEEIQLSTTKNYLARILPHLDTSDSKVYIAKSITSSYSTRPHWFTPRSKKDLPEYADKSPKANDTATMISYWPLTDTEKLTLDLEGYFYTNDINGLPVPRFNYIGQDIKVMSVRYQNIITVTLAIPQITKMTDDKEIYFERERQLEKNLQAYANELIAGRASVNVVVNTQSKGPNARPYLVTGGSCIDFGEEGAVGRGNKTHGIISSFRPNTMEAPHGKNPTYFVGKLLGYQADYISKSIYQKLGTKCQVILQANIGDDIFDPSQIIISTDKKVSQSELDKVVAQCLELGRKTTQTIIDELYFLPRVNAWPQNG